MAINLKNINELEQLSELSGNETVLVNSNGTAKAFPANKFASSWNDLTDKPFGESFDGIEAIPGDEVWSYLWESIYQAPASAVDTGFAFYFVEINGQKYDDWAYVSSNHWSVANGQYVLSCHYDASLEEEGRAMVISVEPSVPFTIWKGENTVNKIPAKYIPPTTIPFITFEVSSGANFNVILEATVEDLQPINTAEKGTALILCIPDGAADMDCKIQINGHSMTFDGTSLVVPDSIKAAGVYMVVYNGSYWQKVG